MLLAGSFDLPDLCATPGDHHGHRSCGSGRQADPQLRDTLFFESNKNKTLDDTVTYIQQKLRGEERPES